MDIALDLTLNTTGLLDDLSSVGVASFGVLPDDVRQRLLTEASQYQFEPREKVVGKAHVRQELSAFDAFPAQSLFCRLRDAFQRLLVRHVSLVSPPLFATPLALNDMVLQRYAPGPIGITPHRDHLHFVNLVCIFTLEGRARFCVCEDRSGSGAREIDSRPGIVVLLRAPGFRGSDIRSLHFLSDIREPRTTFALRQRREER